MTIDFVSSTEVKNTDISCTSNVIHIYMEAPLSRQYLRPICLSITSRLLFPVPECKASCTAVCITSASEETSNRML